LVDVTVVVLFMISAFRKTVFADAASGEHVPVARRTGGRGQSVAARQTEKRIPAAIAVVHTFAPFKGKPYEHILIAR
jgi:hypothetical protein